MGGLATAILRSFLTVPLHASTGIMIGANLVPYRFSPTAPPGGEDNRRDDDGGGRSVTPDRDSSEDPTTALAAASSSSSPSRQRVLGRAPTSQQHASSPGAACSLPWWREQCSSVAQAVWAPVLLHGTYDALLFVAAGECGPWAWLFLPTYLGVVAQGFFIRWRVFTVEREYPSDKSHDVHAKIRNGEVSKPCICCSCGPCVCCSCCECCY